MLRIKHVRLIIGTNVRIFGGVSVPQDKLAAAIAYVQKTEWTEDEYIQGYLKGVEGVLQLVMEAEQRRSGQCSA